MDATVINRMNEGCCWMVVGMVCLLMAVAFMQGCTLKADSQRSQTDCELVAADGSVLRCNVTNSDTDTDGALITPKVITGGAAK